VLSANLLSKAAHKQRIPMDITIIGRSPLHTYQPGLLFIPFRKPGYRTLADIQRDNRKLIGPGTNYVCDEIVELDPDARLVITRQGRYEYDWLISALGCRTVLDEVPGLQEHWGKRVHGFYTPDSALSLAAALERFDGGDLVVDVADMPIKCPVAPIEFACLADEYLRRRGIRNRTRLTMVTPLSGAFTKPICNDMLIGLLNEKGIEVVPNSTMSLVEDDRFSCPEGREVRFDLLVTVPPHEGSAVLEAAGLGDGLGFGLTDKFTLKSRVAERIFLLGDNTNVPTSKAGSVAHFQAEVVVHNMLREIAGKSAEPLADGHANCFIETGFNKAILIDFNYDIQPVPGRFPLPFLGPMSLLRASRTNHFGKLAFKHIYWHMLLPGHPIPFVSSRMRTAGKRMEMLEKYR